jgi:hypothetical protein
MSRSPPRPVDVARRLSARRNAVDRRPARRDDATWRRETFVLSREDARELARDWFQRFPKAAYMTEIEWWRELEDGRIEFTMRRLPTAD